MTTHGAYTKAMAAARHARGYAHDAGKNIDALNAAYPLPEDPELARQLNEVAEAFNKVAADLSRAKEMTYKLAERYLAANKDRITKDYEISSGGPSMRTRLKSKKDGR